jgi:hypothetical protein
MTTWKEVLEELQRCDGQITDYGRPARQILFDPAVGTSHSGQGVEWEIFLLLRDEGWISTEDQGSVKRYRLSEMGIIQLNNAELPYDARAGAA